MGGLATLLEQGNERWLENTQPSEGISQGREFAREWRNVDLKDTKYFYAETSVCPLNDHSALLVGDELNFTLKSSGRAEYHHELKFECSGTDGLGIQRCGPSFRVAAQQPGDYLIRFTSGHYQKSYKISVLMQRHPEEFESLDTWFKELEHSSRTGNEAFTDTLQWHEASGARLNVPSEFKTGLIEYHMGLRHEQESVADFGARYERAACLLYPFVAYSRLASFVVHYFAYRTNAWRLFWGIEYFPNLFAAARFFSTEYTSCLRVATGAANDMQYRRPLLINKADDCLIAAVRAFQSGELDKASALCNEASRVANEQANDPQRAARLELMQARIARRNGEARQALHHYLNLTTHPDFTWSEEAKLFIKEQE